MPNGAKPARTLANRDGHKVVDVKFCVDNPSAVSPERLRSEFNQITAALKNGDFVELPRA